MSNSSITAGVGSIITSAKEEKPDGVIGAFALINGEAFALTTFSVAKDENDPIFDADGHQIGEVSTPAVISEALLGLSERFLNKNDRVSCEEALRFIRLAPHVKVDDSNLPDQNENLTTSGVSILGETLSIIGRSDNDDLRSPTAIGKEACASINMTMENGQERIFQEVCSVSSDEPDKGFARPGDSGAAVYGSESGALIGLALAGDKTQTTIIPLYEIFKKAGISPMTKQDAAAYNAVPERHAGPEVPGF